MSFPVVGVRHTRSGTSFLKNFFLSNKIEMCALLSMYVCMRVCMRTISVCVSVHMRVCVCVRARRHVRVHRATLSHPSGQFVVRV
jgi:hypothetical protein